MIELLKQFSVNDYFWRTLIEQNVIFNHANIFSFPNDTCILEIMVKCLTAGYSYRTFNLDCNDILKEM